MLRITELPAFTDNYIWAIHDTQHAWVVDPGQAGPVDQWLAASGLTLRGILLTHHHGDHIGGVAELLAGRSGMEVIGPRAGRDAGTMPWLTQAVKDRDAVQLAPWGATLHVLETPGHTLDHVCYFAADTSGETHLDTPALFCGDTLFAARCGRLFEGSADQMWASLSALARLPSATRVFCAHEYTVANLRFAAHTEPGNARVAERLAACIGLHSQGRCTLPSTIGIELETNPFMRAGSAAEFARRRALKDAFRA
jgi:hydroxyacylglutathione hydrolase